MLVKEAKTITWSLSEPSKMPGYGFGLPTWACDTGSKLALIDGSVCQACYAKHGHYSFTPCQEAMEKRLVRLKAPKWAEAMATQMQGLQTRYFRWHDSGDIQGMWHFKNIVSIAIKVPDMLFWLPTKEFNIIRDYAKVHEGLPANLQVRVSATMIDGAPPRLTGAMQDMGVRTSTVHFKEPPIGFACPAPKQQGKCGSCRACWSGEVDNVSYFKH